MLRSLIVSSLMFAGTVLAGPTVGGDGAQRAVIDGVISGPSMQPLDAFLGDAITAAAKGKAKSKTLDIVINSPGGSVVAGFEFLSLMAAAQDSGYNIRCFVYHVAASMAFQILLQCNERYTLDNAFLLWHRARIMMGGMFGSAVTGPQLAVLGRALQDTDAYIYSDLRSKLTGASDSYTRYHFENETLHLGKHLSQHLPDFITTAHSIPGLIPTLADTSVTRTAKQGFFDKFAPGEIIYIWNQAGADAK